MTCAKDVARHSTAAAGPAKPRRTCPRRGLLLSRHAKTPFRSNRMTRSACDALRVVGDKQLGAAQSMREERRGSCPAPDAMLLHPEREVVVPRVQEHLGTRVIWFRGRGAPSRNELRGALAAVTCAWVGPPRASRAVSVPFHCPVNHHHCIQASLPSLSVSESSKKSSA